MNAIRQTALLNKRELENATPPSASWHADYRDTAWIYVGGLPLDLSEGDVITIFSQFGNPTHLNLIRDKESGKSKGFGFLKYEDQRSCDLAVDNLGGADVLGRLLRVDHTRYKRRDDEGEDDFRIDILEKKAALENGTAGAGDTEAETESESERDDDGRRAKKRRRRKMLKEERELEDMLALKDGDDADEQDPMRDYLIREKKEEVERARERRHRHRHHRHHRHRHRDDSDDDGASDDQRRHHHRHRQRDDTDDDDGASGDHRRYRHKQRRRDDDDSQGKRDHHTHDRRRSKSKSRSRSRSRSRRERRSRSFSPSAYRSSRGRSASPSRRRDD